MYEWNGTTNTINTLPNPVNASKDDSFVGHLLVLPTGQILWTDFTTTGVELFNSAGTYQPAWQPTITTAPSSLTIGQTYPISGTQFNGLTNGGLLRRRQPGQHQLSSGANRQQRYLARLLRPHTRSQHDGRGRRARHLYPPTSMFRSWKQERASCMLWANGIPSAPSACNVAQPAGIFSPAAGSRLTNNAVTFQWGGNPSATAYWLDVGSTQGGNNYLQSGNLSSSTLSLLVPSLPTDGSTVWVRWYYMISGTFQFTDYSYTALGGSSSLGSINTPAPGSVLGSTSQAFTWSAGTGATAYWLSAGSTVRRQPVLLIRKLGQRGDRHGDRVTNQRDHGLRNAVLTGRWILG